eukprot:gene4314-8578_t
MKNLLPQCFFVLYLFGHYSSNCTLVSCDFPQKYKEDRKLHVATCDSRSGIKGFAALKVWNLSGVSLVEDGVEMKNVCHGLEWSRNGFLTKPIMYLDYVRKILAQSTNTNKEYVLLMDSDTFWSSSHTKAIWRNFDCARGKKDVVVATEMQCWIGKYCSSEEISTYYNNSSISTSYSIFINSGVIIGKATKIAKMLEHIVANNRSYYITFKKHKFDDQYAVAHYSLKVAPEDIALDYHQYISASFSIHSAMYPPSENFPFVCKGLDGNLSVSCSDSTMQLARKGVFTINSSSCILRRENKRNMPLFPVVDQLAPEPILWHGNGAGKRTFFFYSGE